MSKRSSTLLVPLIAEPRPSRWLAALQVGALLFAIAAVGRCGLSPPLKLSLILLSISLTALSLRRQGWLGGAAPCRGLRWDGGRWLWISSDGRSVALRLRSAVVWRCLVVLRFIGPGGPRSLCLLPDSLDSEALRRLRLGLRHLPVYDVAEGGRMPP